jgi:hypothetical protein
MKATLEKIKSVKINLPCDCPCHRGKCNHTASPCHAYFKVYSEYKLTLPDQNSCILRHEYTYDSHRVSFEQFPDIKELLEQHGYRVFRYINKRSDFYSYSERRSHSIKPVKNCYLLEDVPHFFRQAPWYSHTDSVSEFADYIIVPPGVDEAEWEITEFGSSNVPHSYPVLEEDPDTGEKFVVLAQCWGRREWWRTVRYRFREGRVEEEVIDEQWKCDGCCGDDGGDDE